MAKKDIQRDITTGKWVIVDEQQGWNRVYRDFLLKCLNAFDLAFSMARSKSEFDFMQTLLRIRGCQDAGWDPWENTVHAVTSIIKIGAGIKDYKTNRHVYLWLYGHIIEASEPYETLANMLEIAGGGNFRINHFPDKKFKNRLMPQTPNEKIISLKSLANKVNLSEVVIPLDEILDKDLRNAIFHSDYAVYGNEVRIPLGFGKRYSHEEIQSFINKAMAYFDAMKNLMSAYKRSYSKPIVIEVPKSFSPDPNEKAIPIIRKGEGLIGIKDNWTIAEIKKGKIPFRMGHFMKYEDKMMNGNPTLCLLPENRIERLNKLLNFFPYWLRRKVVKFAEKRKWFG